MPVLIDYIQKNYPWLTVALVINSVTSALLIAIIFKWLWSRRRMYVLSSKLPGPSSWPFLGSIFTIGQSWSTFDKMKTLFNEHLKYESPFGIWLLSTFAVVLTDTNDIEALTDDNNVPFKPQMFYFWSRGIGNGLWTGHGGTAWKKHRILLNSVFNDSTVTSYKHIIHKHSDVLKDTIIQYCGSEETFDANYLLEKYSGNVMSEILLGDDNLQEERSERLLFAMRKIRSLVNERIGKFWLHPDFIFKRSNCQKETRHYRHTLEEYVSELFETKKQEFFKNKSKTNKTSDSETISTSTALLALIEAQNNSHGLSDKEVIEEIMSIHIKGIDSFYTTQIFFVMMIAMHEDCQKKLAKEIDENFTCDDEIVMEKIEKLEYLNMCYRETLRLFPHGAFITKFADKDLKLSNKNIIIPSGTVVVIPQYFINRNEKYWHLAELFKPERFSTDSNNFLPFGIGQRNCIGERLGSYLIKSTVVFLLRHFEFRTETKMNDFQPTFDNSVRPPSKCYIRAVKRKL